MAGTTESYQWNQDFNKQQKAIDNCQAIDPSKDFVAQFTKYNELKWLLKPYGVILRVSPTEQSRIMDKWLRDSVNAVRDEWANQLTCHNAYAAMLEVINGVGKDSTGYFDKQIAQEKNIAKQNKELTNYRDEVAAKEVAAKEVAAKEVAAKEAKLAQEAAALKRSQDFVRTFAPTTKYN